VFAQGEKESWGLLTFLPPFQSNSPLTSLAILGVVSNHAMFNL
jgi:hypothetical protein